MTTAAPAPISLHDLMERRAVASIRAHKDIWAANARANRDRIQHEVGLLWMDANPKIGVLVAAGPSLEASLPELRALDRATHEIVAVDMALDFLLASGLKPDYVICSDASKAIAQTMASEADIPLLLNVVVDRDTAKDWKGPIYWYAMVSNVFDKDAGDLMQKMHTKLSGVTSLLVPGGNVGSLGLSFLLSVRAVPKVLLFGHDFCWTDEARFYCGGAAPDLAAERIRAEKGAGTVLAMKDVEGRDVWTNASLLYFKGWFEDQMARFPGAIENRTLTTILSRGGTK